MTRFRRCSSVVAMVLMTSASSVMGQEIGRVTLAAEESGDLYEAPLGIAASLCGIDASLLTQTAATLAQVLPRSRLVVCEVGQDQADQGNLVQVQFGTAPADMAAPADATSAAPDAGQASDGAGAAAEEAGDAAGADAAAADAEPAAELPAEEVAEGAGAVAEPDPGALTAPDVEADAEMDALENADDAGPEGAEAPEAEDAGDAGDAAPGNGG